jgi:tRNA threonylcarbamoyladenosine biosynthesis protein TsaE
MEIIYTLDEITLAAQTILENSETKVLLFQGEMGAGKTTLIKEIGKQLGVIDKMSSPTFSLVNEYRTNNNERVFHFDFYRIEKTSEALDIGFEEYIESDCYCLIEWPQKIQNLVPLNVLTIAISQTNNEQRTLKFNNG